MADVCQSCGSWDTESNCTFCSIRVCAKCKTNHENVCEVFARRKRLGLGPTVRNAGMNSNRAVIPTQDDFVGGMQRLTSAEVQKIIDDYRQVLVTGLEILPKEKTDVDSLQVCNGGGSTEEGMVLSQAPDQPAPSEGQEPISTTKTESVPSGAGTANVASESSRIATMTAILGAPYGETNVANASENPASETSTGLVDSSQGLDDGHSLSEISAHDVNMPIEGSRNPD